MIKIPLHCLVLAVGPSGAGKTTLLRQHFPAYEIIASDEIRAELSGDFRRQDFNTGVFDHVRHRTDTKLSLGERAVVDATHLTVRDRSAMVGIAADYGVPLFYLVVNRSLDEKLATAGWRAGITRQGRPLVVWHDEVFHRHQTEILRGDGVATVIDTRRTGFAPVTKLNLDDPLGDLQARGYRGVLAVADVHGMLDRLTEAVAYARSEKLFLIFLGDVLDYGPDPLGCLTLIRDLFAAGEGVLLWGNHERKIFRWAEQKLDGIDNGLGYQCRVSVTLSESNLVTVRQIDALPPEERVTALRRLAGFLRGCRQHLEIDRTMFVHAAAHRTLFGQTGHRLHGEAEIYAMFGQTDGVREPTPDGHRYPQRLYGWVNLLPPDRRVIVGHDIQSLEAPVVMSSADGQSQALFLDTGCGKGGCLSAAVLEIVDGRFAEPVVRTF